MDSVTAGTALIIVQLCVALIMAGSFYAAPSEKCTRYWALSGICVAVGVLMVILNSGTPHLSILFVGNNLLILGLVLQWCGIRAFFRRRQGYAAWVAGALFFMVYAVQLAWRVPVSARAVLSAGTILTILLLNMFEVGRGRGRPRSFARMLTLGALLLLVVSYGMRFFGLLANKGQFLPNSSDMLSITLLYLMPIVGGLLLSNGLLLLYFERVVADKHHLATHDELTGLLNRRAIVAGGERELKLAARLGLPLTVALADIDHFKQINDTFGHDAGDSVIVEVARTLAETCRSIDLIGRYGGEEFCMVFPGVDREQAAAVAERLVSTVARHQSGTGRTITISIGLASLSGEDQERAWSDLVRRADQALYAAKKAGRNGFAMSP